MRSPWFTKLENTRVMTALRFFTQYRFKEVLAVIVIIGTLGLGISLVSSPERFLFEPTFRTTFDWAKPEVWGAVYCTLALLLGISMAASRRQGMWPALGLTFLYGAFTTSMLVNYSSGSVPSAIWVYLTMCLVCALLTASCVFHMDLNSAGVSLTGKTIT